MCRTCVTHVKHYKICPPNHGVTYVLHMCTLMCKSCALNMCKTSILSCATRALSFVTHVLHFQWLVLSLHPRLNRQQLFILNLDNNGYNLQNLCKEFKCRSYEHYHKYNLNKNSRILLLAIISQNVYILKRVHSILYKAINACS